MSKYSDAILALAPAVYYRLGEALGNAADSSGNALTATAAGGLTYGQRGAIAGDPDTAVLFNGTTGTFSAAHNALMDVGDTFSIAAWIKLAALGANQTIVTKGVNSPDFRVNSSNKLELVKNFVASSIISTVTLIANRWYFVACTKNGAAGALYVDGVDVSGAVSQTMANTVTALTVSGRGASEWFNGTLDEVAWFGSVLTPANIATLNTIGNPSRNDRRRRR